MHITGKNVRLDVLIQTKVAGLCHYIALKVISIVVEVYVFGQVFIAF